MAYEKKSAVTSGTPVPAHIVFYYEVDKLFNSASIRSGYRAKMIKDQSGESQLDDIQLSADEKAIFLEFLEQGLFDTLGELFKITGAITSPIFFNIDYTPSGGTAKKCCGGKILDYASYNENILGNIDKKIENCLRYFVLREWYISCSQGEDAKVSDAQFSNYLKKMKNLSFDLRKPLMS